MVSGLFRSRVEALLFRFLPQVPEKEGFSLGEGIVDGFVEIVYNVAGQVVDTWKFPGFFSLLPLTATFSTFISLS